MIWDCFLYSGEKECLEIRREELKPLGVIHVLVQSFETFSGNEKTVTYFSNNNRDLIAGLLWKLPIGTAWEREAVQRNYIMNLLVGAQDDDIVIISDADEIPYAEAVKMYSPNHGVASLSMDLYYYYLNCL